MTRRARAAAALGLAALLTVAGTQGAAAHVLLETATPNGDGTTTLTFSFEHGCDGAPTTGLDVTLPEVGLTQPELGIGPFTPTVTRTGPGTYLASIDLPMAGAWDVTVGVRTSKYENPVVTLPVEVSP